MSNNLITIPLSAGRQAPLTPLTFALNLNNNFKNAVFNAFPAIAANAAEDIAVIAQFEKPGLYYAPDNDEMADLTHAYGAAFLNKPVYGTLTLGNTDPHVQNGNTYTGIDGKNYTFDNIVLPVALVDMNQPSIIGKTKITGLSGTVKQYITLDDWSINIHSVVMYPADNSPVDFMQALNQVKQAQVSIPVTNYFLNAFGVTHIVIEDISTAQEEGKYSSIAFTIKACSDIPLKDFLP
jgi:hypothetical protein